MSYLTELKYNHEKVGVVGYMGVAIMDMFRERSSLLLYILKIMYTRLFRN